nr:aspartyl/asparaginyl beta-hydroxylase isoform X1 [Onthophagus taurus]
MSGDVQPKKRKDKRKKKEDHQEDVHQPTTPTPPTLIADDTNIHIHKEKTIGGGICAKCIFFIITLAIAIVLGYTIVEHRGLTDIDIPLSESRFATIFEGWIDTSPDHDDHHDEVSFDDHDDHEDEEDEGIGSEEDEHEESEEAEQEESEQEESEHEESEQDESEVEQEESEQEIDESQEIQAESDEQDEEEQDDEDDDQNSQSDDQDDEQPIESEEEEEEQTQISDEQQEDEEDEGVEEIPVKDKTKKLKRSNRKDVSDEDKDEDQEGDENDVDDATNGANTGMAAKVSVGVALLIVAYVVLIKKWKTERTDKPSSKREDEHQKEDANLSRRNTIVPPPTLEEIEQDLENEEEYSEEEEEEESDSEIHVPATKKQYEELRAKYTRSLTPETKEDYEEDEDVDEEEEEYEEEYEEEDEDEELMKKLEEKYGKLGSKNKYEDEEEEEEEEEIEEEEDDIEDGGWKRVQESDSDDDKPIKKRSGAQSYEFENITNSQDYLIRDSLDTAERHLPNNLPLALTLFIKILEDHPGSPRALYGRARALDQLAEKKRSNEILQESIKYFAKVLNAKYVPDALFLAAAKRCIERMRFIGNYAKSIEIHQKLLEKFPNEIKYRNDFAVTLLTINKVTTARMLLLETLEKWPEDGFALVHYGFILKTVDNNLSLAIEYLTKGIATKEPGVIDGRFYFHLGDALARIGKPEEAIKIYEDGVINKVFLSKYQRSLYNVNRLTGKPFWEPEQTPYDKLYELLRQNWKEIRNEGLSMLDKKGYFKDESENLKDVGDWKQFELYARGVKNKENCLKCPITCQIIEASPETRTCRRGQVKFSVMHPGTHVWPHCGPTNCRLRVHLGLKVPPKTYIRVAEEIRSWEEGKIIVFDDSFEHEVWHNGTEYRLVLIVDVWHPELTKAERVNLSPI